MTIPTEEVTFINMPTFPDWPTVALFVDGTDLVIATIVTNKQAREAISLAQIQERLTYMFGAFAWTEERDHAMRCTELRGVRSLLTEGGLT